MPGILEAAGASIQPSSAAPLHTNEFFTGLWTNGSPLGPGAVPFLYSKFYGATRYDRLVDGNDCEISQRLTLIRRPGHVVYNPGPFPPINRFFEFRGFTATDEIIHLLADCDHNEVAYSTGTVREVTQPNTNKVLWNKSPYAGKTSFVSVGNVVYAGDGHDTHQWVTSANKWGGIEATINGIQVVHTQHNHVGAFFYILIVSLDAIAPELTAGTLCTFAGLTGYTALNGQQLTWGYIDPIAWGFILGPNQVAFSFGTAIYGFTADTGTMGVNVAGTYPPGTFIVDSNGNIQMSVGSVTATVVNIQVDDVDLGGGSHGRKVTLYLSSATPFDVPDNISITTSGLTTVAAANGTTPYNLVVSSVLQSSWIQPGTTIPITGYSPETGQATTGTGASGSTQPVWNTNYGQVTQDGGNQWVNLGSAAMPWGSPGPTTAPTVSTTSAPSIYPTVATDTWYAPNSFVIQDPSGNLQQLVAPASPAVGVTGGAPPGAWGSTIGALTTDGTCQWKCVGGSAWQASHTYAVGDIVKATYGYTTVVYQWTTDGHGGFIQVPVNQQQTATSQFRCTTGGLSGLNPPSWLNGVGVSTQDNQVVWKNMGAAATGSTWPGATQNLSMAPRVIDPNGYLQVPTIQGKTGTTAPTGGYNTTVGGATTDGAEVWQNAGPYSAAATDAWIWAYSGKNSVTGAISNASPQSLPLVPGLGQVPVIQGQGLPAPPWDTIVLWRTAAGGSDLLYDDEFPNPGPNATWIYTDTNLDPGNVPSGSQGVLNEFITAPINNENDPPPSNFVPECYYLGRIWGYTNNVLRWTGGPDTGTGNGDLTMPPVNQFQFPSKGVICWPTSVGLICFTTTDIWAVLGQGTDSSPFYVVNFQQGIGMASSDAFGVNGSTAYCMLTSHQLVSIDPGAGELEVGFPIADLLDSAMDPNLVYVTWHQGRSADTALYVANGSQYWYRMAAVSAPESGNVWSPAAVIRAPGQVRAMASIEITPGEKKLILGPNVNGQPILMRDPSLHADNGIPYPAHATIAPIVLSQPGSTAGVQFVVTEEKLVDGAAAIVVKMLFDEIHDFIHVHEADWRTLRNISNDPPNLPKQKSFLTQRLWAQQDPSTVIKCRFYEQDLSWPAEDYANELYTNTVYGRLPEKARK